MAETSGPYGLAAGHYWRAAWVNPIPVRGKKLPPKGFTGESGVNVTWPDLQTWIDGPERQLNVAIRSQGTWVGIDVDAHDGGDGAATLAKAVAELGELPPTYSSTSRGPGQPSRIYFYAVPAGTVIDRDAEHKLRGRFGKGIDVIRRSHRYAVVWPSVHPDTGDIYQWYGPGGELTELPTLAAIASLPTTWLEYITEPAKPMPTVDDLFDTPGWDSGTIPDHERHDTLMRYACHLLTAAPGLSFGEYETLCRRRWEHCEQPPAAAYNWTWQEAQANPVREVWDRYTHGEPVDQPTGRQLVLTAASDIEPAPVVWAWTDEHDDLFGDTGRIPLGSLSIAAGREGTGKSSFGIWLAAKITRGELPGSMYGKPRAVIYAAVEDSWRYTLVPRLTAAGADLTRVYRVEVVEDDSMDVTLSLPADNSLLRAEMLRVDAGLLVLDPLMSTIGAGIDTHREREVRMALDPLATLADRTQSVVLGIAHFNKGAGTDPSTLITGSGAFKNVPRSVFGFAVDGEGSRVMSQTKNSLGRIDLASLSYQIEPADVPTKTGIARVGHLVWLGQSARSVTDILTERQDSTDDQDERQDAAEWLRSYLADNSGEAQAIDVFKAGEKNGFSKDTLKRVKKRIGARSEKTDMDGGWMWRIPGYEGSEAREGSKGADGTETAPLALPSPEPHEGSGEERAA